MHRVLSQLSVGPSSAILCATHPDRPNTVLAVKAFARSTIKRDDGVSQRLLRERCAHEQLSQQTHDNIVSYVGFYSDAKLFCLAMEYVSGGDLFTKLMTCGPMDEVSMRQPAFEVCSALGHLHSLDFVHLDLKTENILITAQGRHKLADYGSCVRLRRPEERDEPPAPVLLNDIIGTPETMAPEVILQHPVCEMADWWSYGCVVYEMLTAESPFYDADNLEIPHLIQRIARCEFFVFPNASMFSGAIVDLVQSLLVRSPSLRLGARPNGELAVVGHPWFNNITQQQTGSGNLNPLLQEGATVEQQPTHVGGGGLLDMPYVFADAQMPAGEELMTAICAHSQPITGIAGWRSSI